MNLLEIKKVRKNLNWIDYECYIDGVRLSQYLHLNKTINLPDNIEPFDDLCLAWTKQLDYWGDVRFVWKLIEEEKAILPVYMCPDDLDFSCIVIVAEVEKNKDFVYWNRIGLVQQKDYDFSIEKKMGILDTDSYTDEDWVMYGDNIALSKVNSDEWCRWISANWDEELYRRRMNYTHPSYNKNSNIIWFAMPDWEFERSQYEKVIDEYWMNETLDEINEFSCKCKELPKYSAINLVKRISRNGDQSLADHKKDYNDVLLHIYFSEEISEPLFDLLKTDSHSKYVLIYSRIIELLWKYGDEEVKNVVDVTLLERLSDDEEVWNKFGKMISAEFREYINSDLLSRNIMMCGVKPINVSKMTT